MTSCRCSCRILGIFVVWLSSIVYSSSYLLRMCITFTTSMTSWLHFKIPWHKWLYLTSHFTKWKPLFSTFNYYLWLIKGKKSNISFNKFIQQMFYWLLETCFVMFWMLGEQEWAYDISWAQVACLHSFAEWQTMNSWVSKYITWHQVIIHIMKKNKAVQGEKPTARRSGRKEMALHVMWC